MNKQTPIQEDGTTEYFKQLTKYNKYGKNKNTFHDKSKSESIPDQIKQLYSLLDEKDKAQLIAFLAGSHSIGEEIVKKLEEANPYNPNWASERMEYGTWRECVQTLRSLINQQSLTN